MKLDINENNLILDIPKKYYLDVKLSYPVFPEKGNAKYDSKTKKLKINLVVDQSKIVEKIEETPKMVEEISEKNEEKEENFQKEENKNEEEVTEIKAKTPEKEEDNFENEKNEEQNNENLLEFHEQNYYLKVKESLQKNQNLINETEDKVLVEEIQNNENIEAINKSSEQKIESKIKIPIKLEFKTQETAQKYFIILNIPKYSKENCQFRKLSQEVLNLSEMIFLIIFRFCFVAKMKKK